MEYLYLSLNVTQMSASVCTYFTGELMTGLVKRNVSPHPAANSREITRLWLERWQRDRKLRLSSTNKLNKHIKHIWTNDFQFIMVTSNNWFHHCVTCDRFLINWLIVSLFKCHRIMTNQKVYKQTNKLFQFPLSKPSDFRRNCWGVSLDKWLDYDQWIIKTVVFQHYCQCVCVL